MDAKVYSDAEMQDIMNSLRVKEKINNYECGFQTQLTYELSDSGEMLSIGQSQCLALARILINPENSFTF